MQRIAFTLAVGKGKYAAVALGLGRSLRLIGDDTRRVIATNQPDHPWDRCFHAVLPFNDPLEWVFFSKLRALEWTEADQVLYIDGDSLAFRRLDPIFEYCQGKGLCVQGRLASSGPWHGVDLAEICRRHDVPALPTFNGGLIYYERTAQCEEFLQTVREYGQRADELGFKRIGPMIPEEPIIALVMAKTGYGHLIPDEMDFTNPASGLIGKLELDVMRNRCSFVCRRQQVRFVRPYLFHAARYVNFLIYWRQLDALEALERYEQTHGPAYMPPLHRLRRSIERRILKFRGRL